MMKGKVTEISQFKFNSLRKYMQPIYTILNQNLDVASEEKEQFVRKLIPQFCRRLREYRNVTLEGMAVDHKLLLGDLVKFEAGERPESNRDFSLAYVQVFHGSFEFGFFAERVREFYHPSIKGAAQEMAPDLIKRFGIVLPSVDYKNLYASRGKVLEFKKSGCKST